MKGNVTPRARFRRLHGTLKKYAPVAEDPEDDRFTDDDDHRGLDHFRPENVAARIQCYLNKLGH